jgi:hypothetical protein
LAEAFVYLFRHLMVGSLQVDERDDGSLYSQSVPKMFSQRMSVLRK